MRTHFSKSEIVFRLNSLRDLSISGIYGLEAFDGINQYEDVVLRVKNRLTDVAWQIYNLAADRDQNAPPDGDHICDKFFPYSGCIVDKLLDTCSEKEQYFLAPKIIFLGLQTAIEALEDLKSWPIPRVIGNAHFAVSLGLEIDDYLKLEHALAKQLRAAIRLVEEAETNFDTIDTLRRIRDELQTGRTDLGAEWAAVTGKLRQFLSDQASPEIQLLMRLHEYYWSQTPQGPIGALGGDAFWNMTVSQACTLLDHLMRGEVLTAVPKSGNSPVVVSDQTAGKKLEAPPKYDPDSDNWIISSRIIKLLKIKSSTIANGRKPSVIGKDRSDEHGRWNSDSIGVFRRAVNPQKGVAYYLPQMSNGYREKLKEATKKSRDAV